MTKWRELVNADTKIEVIYGGGRKNSEPIQKDFINRFGILCVSAEQSHKNLKRLLEAYSLLDTQIQKLNSLTIVGIRSVGTRKRLKVQANKIRIQLQLPEYLSVEQLTHLYRTQRLLVMPSLEEGLSLPILEAWSQGLPAVASSNTAMEELLVNSDLLFNPYSVDSIKETMSRILSQDSLWQGAVEEIPARISKFSWNQTANLALDAIKEA
jgi:glycosyltransferase involved in cell wall biosynthesis